MMYFIPGAVLGFLVYLILFRKIRPTIVLPSDRWLDIKEFPIPDDARDYYLTNGKLVSHQYMPDYDKFGNHVMDYDNTIATHWMPFPSPPNQKN